MYQILPHMAIGTDWGPNAIKWLHLFTGQR